MYKLANHEDVSSIVALSKSDQSVHSPAQMLESVY